MTNRMMVALGVALLLVKPVLAQTPFATLPAPVVQAPKNTPMVPLTNQSVEPTIEEKDFYPMAALIPGGKGQLWMSAEYLFGWLRGADLPPLVTTSPKGTAKGVAGAVGKDNTSILFGGDSVNDGMRSGFRLETGYWLDRERTLGFETGVLYIENQSAFFSETSNGTPILARPFINAVNNTAQAALIAFPGQSTGRIDVQASSGNLYEAHLDLTENILDQGWLRLNSLVGYRFLRYTDGLRIRQVVNPTTVNFVPGTQIISEDDFFAYNTFHGIDFGLRAEVAWKNYSLDLLTKLAVGHVFTPVNIEGSQEVLVPGSAPVVNKGGLLALPSNSGLHKFSDWRMMPELGVTAGWQLNQNVALRLGYSLLFLDGVVRAGNQIDLNINPGQIPPNTPAAGSPNRPGFDTIRSELWMQSINFSVLFTY